MAQTKKSKKDKEARGKRSELLQALTIFEDDFYDENDPGHREKIGRDRRGRPTVMTKQVIQKLRTAFSIGCTDREACIFAGISEEVFYDFCKKHQDFRQETEELKENPVIFARIAIVDALAHRSVGDSWEYLKRKRKDEFSEMKKVEHTNAVTAKDLEELNKEDVEEIEEEGDPDQE